jgi:uncharacterized membrane protein YbaN (DUF454 family)
MFTTNSQRSEDAPILGEVAEIAPALVPSVVHSSFGRLRVHLPHWSGARGEAISAGLRRFPGVTHAEANPLTGNVLILFEPRQTSARALLEALPALRLEPGDHAHLLQGEDEHPAAPAEHIVGTNAVLGQDHEPEPALPGNYATGTRRVVYTALGWSSVGMAVVGAIVPGIPTTPFVLLAGYFFIRSSPQAHAWLRQARVFGPILRDWEEHHAVRPGVRHAALGLIGASMVATPLVGLPAPVVAVILALQVVGLTLVYRLRVVEPSSSGGLPATA